VGWLCSGWDFFLLKYDSGVFLDKIVFCMISY